MPSAELLEIVGPAFVAGLMIALTHAPLGLEVFKRGIIFIDLAIAQVAGLGVIAAQILWPEPQWWIIQCAALGFALAAALTFRWVERHLPQEQEAIIGTSFVLAASAALLLLANNPHGGEEIQHLLSGEILFVTWDEVVMHGVVYATILAAWFLWPEKARRSIWFYLLFACAITSSVQLVGVYVVFASLILPAIAAAPFRRKQEVAWACGILSVGSGILLSVLTDEPAGPLIVIAYAVAVIVIRNYLAIIQQRRLS